MSARRRLSVGGSFSSRPGVTSLQWISKREKPHLQWCHVTLALACSAGAAWQHGVANAPLLRHFIRRKELAL